MIQVRTNNQTGRNFSLFIGIYIVLKAVLNMIIGDDSFWNVIYSLVEAVVLYTGLMYINYVIAVILAIVVLVNLKNNITNFSSNWIYLLEGIVDLVCAVLLVVNKDIKGHFTNKWSEISNLFSRK